MKTRITYFLFTSMLIFACKKTEKETILKQDTLLTTSISSSNLTTNSFLALSDVHFNNELNTTSFGNVTGDSLWTRAKAKIEAVAKNKQPKFLVYLGDLPGYDNAARAENSHFMLENLRNLAIDIPILYLPGNNDSLIDDYYSFTDANGNTVLSKDANPSDAWAVLRKNSSTTKTSNIDFNKEFGFYSVNITTGKNTLKVIALNTVIFSNKGVYNSHTNSHNKKVGSDGVSQQQATQIQMRWLENTLDSLDATTKVLLMMHIPPGKDGFKGKSLWDETLNYVNTKGDTLELQNAFLHQINNTKIVGLLNGHTHLDGLRRIYKSHHSTNTEELIALSISTPGTSVNHDNNPGFKLFTYNSDTYDLLNFETHFASPTNASKTGNFQFLKDSSYTFKEAYQIKSLGSTILSDIKGQEKDTIIKHLNAVLGVKSNQKVYLKHHDALDVHLKKN